MNVPRLTARVSRRALVTVLVLVLAALAVTLVIYQFPVTSVVDVGSGRDTPFVQGFSFRENSDGGSLRWTTGRGEIYFWGVGAQDGALTVRLNVPAQNAAAGVEVWVNDHRVDTLRLAPGWTDATIPVTRADIGASGNLFVRLVSATLNAPPDPRQLGVQVDTASFSGRGAPVFPAPRALFYVSALVALAFVLGGVWGGSRRIGVGVALVTLAALAYGLVTWRVETAYFSAPLFWTALILFAGALLFVRGLKGLTRALPAPPLAPRTLRLLLLVMAAAFALRMVFAVGPGYIVDVQDYIVWSYKTVTYGLGSMYASVAGLWISDQSPGLNYVLHLVGLVYHGVFAPDFLYPVVAGDPVLRGVTDNPALLADPVQRTLLRLPQLLADVLAGALIFTAARKYVAEWGAWLAALAFWFNPAVIWNGAYWGQTDALHALLVLSSFLLIVFPRRVGWAFFILGIAALTKPQAVVYFPLLLLAAYKTGAADTELAPRPSLAALKPVAWALLWAAVGAGLVFAPVVLTGGTAGALAYFGDTVGHHPILTANAHNIWWLIFHDDFNIPDTAELAPGFPLSYRAFSLLLFGAFYLAVLFKGWRAPLESFFGLGAFVGFIFFMLPTEIHENYGYALLPLLAVAMTRERILAVVYVAVSLTMTLNYALHDPPLYDALGLSDPHAQLAAPRRLNAALNVLLLGAWTVYLFVARQSARARRPLEARGAS